MVRYDDSPYRDFVKPRLSEQHLFWICFILLIIGVALFALLPPSALEPGHTRTQPTEARP